VWSVLLDEHDEVAAGVVEHCLSVGVRGGGFLGEPDAVLGYPFVVGLQVGAAEHGVGHAGVVERFLVNLGDGQAVDLDPGVSAGLQQQVDAVGGVRGDDGEPCGVTDGDVGLL
jgi:hypothetical protein